MRHGKNKTGSDSVGFVAKDAGASYFGVYGMVNVWTAWLLSRSPELLARTPRQLRRSEPPPRCRQVERGNVCNAPMVLRTMAKPKADRRKRSKKSKAERRRAGGIVWKCYRHEQTVVVAARFDIDGSPDRWCPCGIVRMTGEGGRECPECRIPFERFDVLRHLRSGKTLDYVFRDDEWRVVER